MDTWRGSAAGICSFLFSYTAFNADISVEPISRGAQTEKIDNNETSRDES